VKSFFKWVFGKALLYIGLVLAVAFGTLALPIVLDRLGHGGLAMELMSPQALAEQFTKDRGAALARAGTLQAEIAKAPAEEVTRRLSIARAELSGLNQKLQAPLGLLAAFSPREILDRKRLELSRATLEGEIALLEAASRRNLQAEVLLAAQKLPAQPIKESASACHKAIKDLRTFLARIELEQVARNLMFDEEAALQKEAEDKCDSYLEVAKAQKQAIDQVRQAAVALKSANTAYSGAAEKAKSQIIGVALNPTRTYSSILVTAAFLLAVMLATPLLIRLLFYFVLAPFVQRRRPIDLGDHVGGAPPTLALASATSAPITLAAGEELLVRQGFLQSTSTRGSKRTRALLDWRHPLSSLASGLSFLTRIIGEGETTVISAVHDPLAEVAVLRLDAGGACVLHPRALVAVVKPSDLSLRITSHWRLFSLHAWLTLQLRYLMFHGPCRLVLKGGRGLRLEGAESGRIFGPDQLVGFSPDLAYTVARTETFWPYFMGRESLFKDRVDAGGGVVLIEEAPMGGGGRGPRKGLEGALDVALKAFGL
jgi:uncharacterized protein (AIM24 family)